MARKRVRGAQRSIHRRNLVYHTIYPYTRQVFFHYYGKVEFSGVENIPRGEPVIFAPNHQNALMDALIILFSAPQDVVFLARADIFNKPLLAWFLNSLKILPVFRQRDGAAELAKNQEIFDISVSVLQHRHYLCVMPEGNHGHQRRLRAFGKGIFRIAFAAQKDYGEKPFVKIVPVGLDFGDYVKQHASLYVNYGKPIELSDYWAEFEENGPRGMNQVKKRLIDDLKPLMIHIESEEYYEAIHGVREIYNPRMREMLGIEGTKLSDRFRADKEMIDRLHAAIETSEAKVKEWSQKVETYLKGVEEMRIRDWVVREKGYNAARTLWRYLTLLVTFPFFLYGLVNNAVPYFLPVYLVRNIKDRQFHASVKAGLGMLFIFPFFYALQTLLVGIFTGPWWIWLAYLVTLGPAGKAALYWYFRWKKTVRGSWFRRQLRRGKPGAQELLELRREILTLTDQLVS